MMKGRNILKLLLGLVVIFFGCSPAEKKEKDDLKHEVIVLDPADFKEKLASTPDAVLIDVRTPEELSKGMIEGATNINFKDPGFMEEISKLDKDKPYFVYCLSGKRSGDAIKQMEEIGIKNIYTLRDGYKNWLNSGLETVSP